jgi:hypothetical protein
MPANLRKTAPQRRFMPKLPIRHPQASKDDRSGLLAQSVAFESSSDFLRASWNSLKAAFCVSFRSRYFDIRSAISGWCDGPPRSAQRRSNGARRGPSCATAAGPKVAEAATRTETFSFCISCSHSGLNMCSISRLLDRRQLSVLIHGHELPAAPRVYLLPPWPPPPG